MEASEKDKAIFAVLLKRFEEQRLPRLLEIKRNVEQGQVLTDHEISFLEEVFKDAQENEHLMKKADKSLQELIGKAIKLYQEITQKAMENEQKSQ